ncbi:hypothetical protein HY522_00860 [bacterium]|nr:hypothetical protein [bacterium]
MARRHSIWKWIIAGLIVALVLGLAYLSMTPDPGPYLVALRSDHPDQVSEALDALEGDTRVYNGVYPAVEMEDLQDLGRRYYRKYTGQSQEPLIGDTAAWIGFAHRITRMIYERQVPPRKPGQ